LMGYHKPDVNHPDNAVYDALGSLLSEGRSSRLYRALVRDKKVATMASGMTGFPGRKYPGMFVFIALPAPGKTNEDPEKAIEAELERLKNEPVSAEELDGVKRRARANLLRQLDSNFMLAIQFSRFQAVTGDWRNLFRELERINAVTPQDIQRVAKATFTWNNKTVGAIDPVEAAAK